MDFSKHIFRSSGVHHLMTGTIGLSEAQERTLLELENKKTSRYVLSAAQKKTLDAYSKRELSADNPLTDNQQEILNDIRAKDGAKIGLTDKQRELYDELILKRDKDELLEGTKNYLKKLRKEVKYNRRRELHSKAINKGNANEEEAITMVSLYTGEFFHNNKERVYNDFITGEYDIYLGEDINSIVHGLDTKCSWDLETFPDIDSKLDNNYYWQNQCYMWLSGASKWTTVYCLTNATDEFLSDIKYREEWRPKWKGSVPKWRYLELLKLYIYDEESFVRIAKAWDCMPDKEDDSEENIKAMEIVAEFVDMPLEERLVFKTTERDEEQIENIKQRVDMARDYLVYLESREIPILKL